MNAKIKDIIAREILDSRGNPTIEVEVELFGGAVGIAKVPSGASTGAHEAWEMRDGDKKRYLGKGVLKAAANVNKKIAPLLRGIDARRQQDIDHVMIELDGTANKKRLGANAILGVSLACARAGALAERKPLYKYINKTYKLGLKRIKMPYAMMNILNGGAHANWSLDIQEFMIIPKMARFKQRVRAGSEIFHHLGKILKKNKQVTSVGDEGGFAPRLGKNSKAFDLISQAIRAAKYKPGKNVFMAIDAAASEFYNKKTKKYELKAEKKKLKAHELNKLYQSWIKKYPLISIEDGLDEDDWENWILHTRSLGKRAMLVGDDLFVTNATRLGQGIELGAANAILIKVNQIGSLTQTIDTIVLAKNAGYKVIISHRSGETCDTFIADLAVAVGADYIKTGSLSRSERVGKYNRLMKIEEELR
ncbi:phosphopyruvate hydratase [Patescibacteria group bacterium]|nr:phosphopyruvate hydratase [Patescibacteria group bacterium]MBU1921763.1 phosphopyruvate hydratase [Patescibacteria group bacterium]